MSIVCWQIMLVSGSPHPYCAGCELLLKLTQTVVGIALIDEIPPTSVKTTQTGLIYVIIIVD